MPTTREDLKAKIARIQQELSEVSAALDEMAAPTQNGAGSEPAVTPEMAAAPPSPAEILAGLGFVSASELRPLIDKAFAEMGIDTTQPAMKPEEVQQLMLREGINPEDNLGSRAIIEMREE